MKTALSIWFDVDSGTVCAGFRRKDVPEILTEENTVRRCVILDPGEVVVNRERFELAVNNIIDNERRPDFKSFAVAWAKEMRKELGTG